MYLQLGNIVLEPLTSPLSQTETQETVWAEHPLLNSKPRLQPTGQGLKELTLSVRLHALFCDVKASYKLITDARDNYTVLPLLWGNGDVGRTYVITEITNNRESSFKDGAIESILLNITLKEYVRTHKQIVQSEKTQAQQNATAVNNGKNGSKKTTVANKVTNPPTCNAYIAKQRSGLSNLATLLFNYQQQRKVKVVQYSTTVGADGSSLTTVTENMKNDCQAISLICLDLVINHPNCMQGDMANRLNTISDAAKTFKAFLNTDASFHINAISQTDTSCINVTGNIYAFLKATNNIGNAGILRKP